MKYTLNKKTLICIIILCVLLPKIAISDDYWDKIDGPLKETINIKDYKISREELLESIFHPIIRYKWAIDKVTKNTIDANYKNRARLKITISSETIILEELPSAHYEFKKNWMEALHIHIERNVKTKHYMNFMKSL